MIDILFIEWFEIQNLLKWTTEHKYLKKSINNIESILFDNINVNNVNKVENKIGEKLCMILNVNIKI